MMGPASEERVLRRRGTAPAAVPSSPGMTAAGRKGRSSSAGSPAEMEMEVVVEEPVQTGGRPKRAGAGTRTNTAGLKAQPIQRSQSTPAGKPTESLSQVAALQEGPGILRKGRGKRGKAGDQYSNAPPTPQDPTYESHYEQYQEGQGTDSVNDSYHMDDSRGASETGYDQYESDDSQRSSPAMASAVLALTSIYHGQQGHEGEGLGYAFPLDDGKQPPKAGYSQRSSRRGRGRCGEPPNKRAPPPTMSPGSEQEGEGMAAAASRYEGGYDSTMYSAEGQPMQVMPMALSYEEDHENCRAQGNRQYRYATGQGTRPVKKKDRKAAAHYPPSSNPQAAAMWGKRRAMMMEPGQQGAMALGPDGEQPPDMGSYMVGPEGQQQQMQQNYYQGGSYDDPNYQHQMAPGGHDSEGYDSSSGIQYPPPGANLGSYNRKEKSLGLLCENFIKRFSDPAFQDPEVGISLDRAATVLGVERRRIYDIINILESVCYVSRKCKNTYIWHGQLYLSHMLKQLQDEALDLWPDDAKMNGLLKRKPADGGAAAAKAAAQKWMPDFGGGNVPEDRKEKSLGRLSQKFIQLFLIGYEVISLSGAAEKLLGATPGSITDKGMKTKVRRLYDIANVLTSLRLIDKVHVPDSRKPSFRWVGIDPAVLLAQPYTMPQPLPTHDSQRKSGGGSGSSSSNTSPPDVSPASAAASATSGHRAPVTRDISSSSSQGSMATETPTRQLPPPPPPHIAGGHQRPAAGMSQKQQAQAQAPGSLTPLSPDSMLSYQMSQVHNYMQSYTEQWNQWRTRRLHMGEQAGPPPEPAMTEEQMRAMQIQDANQAAAGTTAPAAATVEQHKQEGGGGGQDIGGAEALAASTMTELMNVTEAGAISDGTQGNAGSSTDNHHQEGMAFNGQAPAASGPPEISGPPVAV